MSEEKPKKEWVTIARIKRDQKFKERLTIVFTDEGVDFLKTGKRFASAKRDSVLAVIKGEQRSATIYASK